MLKYNLPIQLFFIIQAKDVLRLKREKQLEIAKSTNMLARSVWREKYHLVSPTKICPTLLVHTTRICTFMLYTLHKWLSTFSSLQHTNIGKKLMAHLYLEIFEKDL